MARSTVGSPSRSAAASWYRSDSTVKRLPLLLLVSALTGAVAACGALIVSRLNSATLSPIGGALIGLGFGLSTASRTRRASGENIVVSAVIRGVAAGAAGALTIFLLD
jgi:hypothetical protein